MSRINWRDALRASQKSESKKATECVEVAVHWNDTCVQQNQFAVLPDKPFQYRIGETPDCQFMVDSIFIHTSEMSLIDVTGDQVSLHLPPFCHGVLNRQEHTTPLMEVSSVQQVTLAPNERAVFAVGPWLFTVARVPAENPLVGGAGFNFVPNRWTYISVALHAVFFLLMGMVPPDASGMNFDDQLQQNRMIRVMISGAQQPPVEQVIPENAAPEKGNAGQAQAGDTGKAGDRNEINHGKRMAVAGPRDTRMPTIGKELLKEMRNRAGILAFLEKPTITSPFGEGVTIGRDPENVLGDLVGNEIGPSHGMGGMGVVGAGRGGGGDKNGTLGVGNVGFDRFGHDSNGNCVGALCGNSGLRMAKDLGGSRDVKSNIAIRTGTETVAGSLSREIIRRYIRQKVSQIKFCYEKELTANATLSGRLSVMFAINRAGAVTSSTVKDSTIGNANVENCIARVVQRITFPAPPDGGTVIVTYPFNLIQSGN